MFFIQLAVTLAIVYIVSDKMLAVALHPIAILSGRTRAFPSVTIFLWRWSFWLGILSALIGVWSLA